MLIDKSPENYLYLTVSPFLFVNWEVSTISLTLKSVSVPTFTVERYLLYAESHYGVLRIEFLFNVERLVSDESTNVNVNERPSQHT